uniref:Uncharacterized protein n=1 Tax=Oryza barthii TaxID=65489 RepID=A0A0D3F0H6_9ORYZ
MKDFTSSDLSQFHTTKNYYYLTSRLLHYFFHAPSRFLALRSPDEAAELRRTWKGIGAGFVRPRRRVRFRADRMPETEAPTAWPLSGIGDAVLRGRRLRRAFSELFSSSAKINRGSATLPNISDCQSMVQGMILITMALT